MLPEISEFSEEQLQRAKQYSSAVTHYLNLIRDRPSDVSQHLRVARHTDWLRAALTTIHKNRNAEDVCRFWSLSADRLATEAWRASGCEKLPLALFALGKWGAQELNLSSDIDLIFVSKENPTAEEISSARKFISLLSETTDFGFCFRVDTDLKPGGRLAPLVSSCKQLEDYYWSQGATWERLALVRLRAVCGDTQVISSVLATAEKFVYRRFMDFTFTGDLKLLRSQIHSHYPPLPGERVNLKLAPGGIRDIELFIHALQVIHGGKEISLRTHSTSEAARNLVGQKRFDAKDMNHLIESYWVFRQLENESQARDDAHTHEWTAAHGEESLREFRVRTQKVETIVESLLGKTAVQPMIPTEPQQRALWLKELGYGERIIEEKIPELLSLTAISTRTYADEELRLRVLRNFLETLSKVALDRDLGAALLVDFFRATRAKSGFFSLLLHEDRLIRELSVLFGCSPYLGGILTARPELLDSYLYRAQAKPAKDSGTFYDDLADRRLLNEIIAANQWLQHKNSQQIFNELTISADEICLSLLDRIRSEVGPSEICVLALGKWGGREMGLRSDLDFIFVCPKAPTENDHKIARRFLSRLTERHRGGSIFEIDMRLRPSGKAGPLLVQEEALLKYLAESAAPWERQSYLRARRLGHTPEDNFSKQVRTACVQKPLRADDYAELAKIRNQLIRANSETTIQIKYEQGGLLDIEFAAQVEILATQGTPDKTQTTAQIEWLTTNSPSWGPHARHLISTYNFLRDVEQLYQLVNQHPASSLEVNSPGFERVALLLGHTSNDLLRRLLDLQNETHQILKHLDRRQIEH